MYSDKILQPANNSIPRRSNNDFFSGKSDNSFFSPATVQPKLTIGAPNDKYEQEADTMADKVVSMSQSPISVGGGAAPVQTKCAECEGESSIQKMGEEEEMGVQMMGEEEEEVQTKPLMLKSESGGSVGTSALSAKLNSSKGSGTALPDSTNHFMSQAFGTNFSQVRIHTDNSAVQMNRGLQAKAFTHGSDIYFNKGQYRPESSDGKRLLAHELTHVVQQKGSALKDD